METGGDPYLRTPDSQMSVIVRHSLDTYGSTLLLLGALGFLIWKLLGLALISAVTYAGASKAKVV
jgi:hypothetical protein